MTALAQLAEALAERAHLEPAMLTAKMLAPLLAERRRALRMETDAQYAAHALQNEAEFGRLRDLIAVPETWLFRYSASFELLREQLLARKDSSFRALSVACATGAEPLSIAAAAIAAGVPVGSVRVVAVDSSTDALGHARTGTLGRLSAREGIPAWATEWFTEHPDCIRASAALLGCVEWIEGSAPRALAHLDAKSFDAIFCRNLAIYLSDSARRSLGKRLAQLLSPQGVLFLGHAEPPSIFGLDAAVQALEPRGSFGYERCTGRVKAAREPKNALTPAHKAAPRAAPKPRRKIITAAPRHATPAGAGARTAARASEPPSLDAVRAAADTGLLRQALTLGAERTKHGDHSWELLLLLGSAHAALGERAPAEKILRQVVYLQPDLAEALLQLAGLAEVRGDHRMAERYRTRAARGAATKGGAG